MNFIPGQADAFLQELRREIAANHPLNGLELVPLGHSAAADDVLFEAGDGRIVQVHLTFSRRAEQSPFPHFRFYSNSHEWIQQVMLSANEEYRT